MNTDFDTKLRNALIAYNHALVASFPDEAEYAAADFSPRHQRRMEKLFKRCDRFYYPAIRTKARRAMTLAATIALVLVLPLSVSAVRESFTQFVTEVYTVCTDLFFPSSTPSAPFVPTEPTYIPAGFKEVSRESDEISNYIEYRNSDNEEILFYQYQNNGHIASIDTENAQVEKIILNDSIEAMYVYKNGHSQIILTYKNNVYRIISQLSKDQTIAIAESLNK